MRKSVCFFLTVFVAVLNLSAGEIPLKDRPEVASSIRLLEAWIESQMSYQGWPGISIGIVYDQDLIWSKGFGFADLENQISSTPDTIYRIASNSKLFTSIAIMKLRDEGKLQLDDPVAKHLSWFNIQSDFKDALPITIRHLLTHTSGLPRESAFPYWTDFNFPSRKQMIEKISEQKAIYPPETKWKYSNLAMALAGEIVTAVSGEDYPEYIHRYILDPLGMSSTSVIIPDDHKKRLAVGYGRRMPDSSRQIMPFTDCQGIAPAGNLSSTVKDLARFASWQFRLREQGGHEVIRSSTIKEMHRVHWLYPDWQSGWGLGFRVIRREVGDIVGHGGWVGGFQTAFYLIPSEKIAAIVLTNADDTNIYPGSPTSLIDRIFEWVAPVIIRAVEVPAHRNADPKWEKYVGKYRYTWGDRQVIVMNGELLLIDPRTVNPLSGKLTLYPVSDHVFRIEGEGSAEHGELIVFEMGPNGAVVRMKLGENYLHPFK